MPHLYFRQRGNRLEVQGVDKKRTHEPDAKADQTAPQRNPTQLAVGDTSRDSLHLLFVITDDRVVYYIPNVRVLHKFGRVVLHESTAVRNPAAGKEATYLRFRKTIKATNWTTVFSSSRIWM